MKFQVFGPRIILAVLILFLMSQGITKLLFADCLVLQLKYAYHEEVDTFQCVKGVSLLCK